MDAKSNGRHWANAPLNIGALGDADLVRVAADAIEALARGVDLRGVFDATVTDAERIRRIADGIAGGTDDADGGK